MTWQLVGVLIAVAACVGHVAWSLVPRVWRQQFAQWVVVHRLAASIPAWLRSWLEQHAQPVASGCACTGCDKGSAGPNRRSDVGAGSASSAQTAPTVHVVQWVRKPSNGAPSGISSQNR